MRVLLENLWFFKKFFLEKEGGFSWWKDGFTMGLAGKNKGGGSVDYNVDTVYIIM